MNKLLKLLGLLLIPVVALAGVYGYFWYKVKESADQIVQQMSPFATVTYDKVIATFDGQAGVEGIEIVPSVPGGGLITIDALFIKAPSWTFYLDAQDQFSRGELPEAISMQMKGMTLDMTSGFLRDMERAARIQSRADIDDGKSLEALGCGEISQFDLATMRAMGYGQLKFDLSFTSQYDKVDQAFSFYTDMTIERMARVGAEIRLGAEDAGLDVSKWMFAQPELKHIRVDYTDRGYNIRRNGFCARQQKIKSEEYLKLHRTLIADAIRGRGWLLPEDVFNQYMETLQPRSSWMAQFEPPAGFNMTTVDALANPAQAIELVRLYAEVNGNPVNVGAINWLDPEEHPVVKEVPVEAAPEQEPVADVEEPVVAEKDVTEAIDEEVEPVADPAQELPVPGVAASLNRDFNKPEASYKKVALADAGQFIGKDVKLRTYFGRKIEGTLVSVDEESLQVRQFFDRGSAIFPIARSKVSQLQVFY